MVDIAEVKGTIVLADGSTSEFSIFKDAGWIQWGAARDRLGKTSEAVEKMALAIVHRLESDYDDEEE